MDKGTTTGALNSWTVTNYAEKSENGSLVADLVSHECSYTAVEGGAEYQGYDFYRKYIQSQYSNPDIEVTQLNTTNYVRFDVSYGPASIWSFTPPTADPLRIIKYELVFRFETNELLSYALNGTEELPDKSGAMVYVDVSTVNIRTNYATMTESWPKNFFSTECPLKEW